MRGSRESVAPNGRSAPELHDPALYLNRELSHLEFQRRVLEEARDRRNPLLERVKFLSIFGSNIDEFFMVRVAGLTQQIENSVQERGIDGRGPSETLEAIRGVVGAAGERRLRVPAGGPDSRAGSESYPSPESRRS